MGYRNFIGIAAILIAILIAGCSAPTTDLTESKANTEFMTGPLHKVLIVGVSDNAVVRNRFEQELKRHLTKAGVQALGSLEAMPRDAKIERDAFEKYFHDMGIDAILITQVVDVEKLAGFEQGQEYTGETTRVSWAQSNYYSYYYDTYDRTAEVGHFQYGEILRVESDLFDVESENRIWQCFSKSFHKDNTEKIIDDLSKLLVGALKDDGIL